MLLRKFGGLAGALIVGFSCGALALHEKDRLLHPGAKTNTLAHNVILQQSRRLGRVHGAVVFLGDSITEGLATSNIVAASENFGVPGDNVEDLTEQIAHYDLTGASCIVLQIGINNWAKDRFTGFLGKYRKLLKGLPSDVPVVAVGLMPMNTNSKSLNIPQYGLYESIPNANWAVNRACSERKGCTFLNMEPLLSSAGALARAYDVGDGLHLSPAGYEKWETALKGTECVSARMEHAALGVTTPGPHDIS